MRSAEIDPFEPQAMFSPGIPPPKAVVAIRDAEELVGNEIEQSENTVMFIFATLKISL